MKTTTKDLKALWVNTRVMKRKKRQSQEHLDQVVQPSPRHRLCKKSKRALPCHKALQKVEVTDLKVVQLLPKRLWPNLDTK